MQESESDGSSDVTQDSTAAQAPTVDEVSSTVVDAVTPVIRDAGASVAQDVTDALTVRMDSLEASVVSAIESEGAQENVPDDAEGQTDDDSSELVLLTTDESLAYLPTDAPTFAGTFFTPLLWGILAGFLCWIIGYLWESFQTLLGLARPTND